MSVLLPLNTVSSRGAVWFHVVAPKPPVALSLVSWNEPVEPAMRTVRLPLFRLEPRVTSDHSPVTAPSLLMVPRNTFVKFSPRCHWTSAGSSLSRLMPAHHRVLPDCCT